MYILVSLWVKQLRPIWHPLVFAQVASTATAPQPQGSADRDPSYGSLNKIGFGILTGHPLADIKIRWVSC